jgi:hypothetical protein
LDRILIVAPDDQVAAMRLPQVPGGAALRVVSELELVPELQLFTAVNGWYRQMLVKLAAAEWLDSAFYLTLDADVVATRAVDLNALCESGRAPCAVAFENWHPRWYAGAEALIGAPLPRRGISHGVTPTILHREGVRALCAHLDQRWKERRHSPGLRGIKQRLGHAYTWLARKSEFAPWRALLCCSSPWAEYALYFSFLEWTGRFEQYHRETHEALYAAERSVWHPQDVANWNPSKWTGEGPPFIVLQSTAGIPIEVFRTWVEPFT